MGQRGKNIIHQRKNLLMPFHYRWSSEQPSKYTCLLVFIIISPGYLPSVFFLSSLCNHTVLFAFFSVTAVFTLSRPITLYNTIAFFYTVPRQHLIPIFPHKVSPQLPHLIYSIPHT